MPGLEEGPSSLPSSLHTAPGKELLPNKQTRMARHSTLAPVVSTSPLALLLSQDPQLVCKLWAGEPLHHRNTKLLLPPTAPGTLISGEEPSLLAATRTAHTQ